MAQVVPNRDEKAAGKKYANSWWKGLSEIAKKNLSRHDQSTLASNFSYALMRMRLGLESTDALPEEK